jgi:protocatechuate 3,4-dioxygenase beta subunit
MRYSIAVQILLLSMSLLMTPSVMAEKLANVSTGYCLDTDGKAANGSVVRMWQCATHPNQTWTVEKIDSKHYRLINHSSKFCLDSDGSKKNGGKVRMWQCANHPNQLWEVNDLPDDRYRLKNKASGFCLDTDGKAANGSVVRMWQCATHPNQTWSKLDETIREMQKLTNLSSGFCLDTDGKAANGSVVRMWQCATHPNQTWTVDRVDFKYYRLTNHSSKFCLDTDGSKKNGGKVRMWQCANHPNQLWEVNDLPDDRYRLKNKASGFCLDTDGKAANGSVVRMWQCATHPNQTWSKYDELRLLTSSEAIQGHIHVGSGFCDGRMNGVDYQGKKLDSGWMDLHSKEKGALFIIRQDDCGNPTYKCPPGYELQGQFHTAPSKCDGFREGYQYDGNATDSGWIGLCSLPDTALLVIVGDDCTNPTYTCPPGYELQGQFHTGGGGCDGAREGLQYDGNATDSGWMGLCAKPGPSAWLTIGGVDACKSAGGSGGTPTGEDRKVCVRVHAGNCYNADGSVSSITSHRVCADACASTYDNAVQLAKASLISQGLNCDVKADQNFNDCGY